MDARWRAARRVGAAVAGVVALVVVVPVGARAAAGPKITAGPVVGGTPQVGTVLTASATWVGDPPPAATWTWLRCPKANGPCSVITGATAAEYWVTSSDIGSVLRVRLSIANDAGSAEQRSKPTATVIAAPAPPPASTPPPTSTPTPTSPPAATAAPTATPAPVFNVPAAPPVAAPPSVNTPHPPAAPRPSMLKPFPVVRIKGVLTASGAQVTLLSVKAPKGVHIAVACRGHHCPVRRFVPPAGVRRLRPFERELQAGTRLEISVTKPGYIGKSTTIVIRRNAAPWRSDRCLKPGASRAVRCPVA
jgi:hypothetical protein